MGSLGSTPLIPHYQAGTLRLLVQTTQTRSPRLPDIPTFQEAGFTELITEQWIGVFVPAGTPPAIAARINAGINTALADPAVRHGLIEADQEPVGGSSAQFGSFVRSEYEKFGRLTKELNIIAE
jgi:tripartite-type tricarboxylate transporter receptor subunit TctC